MTRRMSGGPPVNGQMMHKTRHTDGERMVKPHSVSDKSYVESFVNIIHDISNAYKNPPVKEEKEVIVWLRLFNLSDSYTEYTFTKPAPKYDEEVILLAVGYTNGIQIWDINDKGNMTEILSLRQGPVKSACVLPPPSVQSDTNEDMYAPQRPLLAMSLAADRKELFTSVSIVSLRTGTTVYTINFKNDIDQLYTACDGVLIVTLIHQIFIYSTYDFSCLCSIDDCYTGPKVPKNPIALGPLWLAYCPKKLSANQQSCGGIHRDTTQSYTASVISAAKTVKKGISTFGDTVNWLAHKGNLTSSDEAQKSNLNTSPRQPPTASPNLNQSRKDGEQPPGVVTVVNLSKLFNHPKCKNPSQLSPLEKGLPPADAVVAHFVAYDGSPVVCMQFSPSGMLLATADKSGHTFNIFTILPHPLGSKYANSQHVYKLYRGDTSAKVQSIVFSGDSRWLTVSTHRGTSHLFPISTYGGNATQRTHLSHCVVNRTSRFHKSAGLEEMESFTSMFSGHPGSSPNSMRFTTSSKHSRCSGGNAPTVVNPIHQIHSGSLLPNQNTLTHLTMQASQLTNTSETKPNMKWQANLMVASFFTTKHLTISQSEPSSHETSTSRIQYDTSSNGEQCLLLMTSDGVLSEYHVHPHRAKSITKVTDESPIDVAVTEKFRWPLQRLLSWDERLLPLPRDHHVIQLENSRQSSCLERINGTNCDVTINNKANNQQTIGNNYDNEFAKPKVKQVHSDSYIQTARKKYNKNYNGKGHAPLPGVAVPRQEGRKQFHPMQIETHNEIAHVNDHCDKTNGIVCDVIDCMSLSPANEFPAKNIEYDDEWLSQVEIVTHEGPARRLWMGPQFSFKTRQSTGSTMHVSSNSSALLSDRHIGGTRTHNSSSFSSDEATITHHQNIVSEVYVDDLDLDSIKIMNNRSEPVPTPNGDDKKTVTDNTYSSIPIIEAGSGSFDQHGHMLEIGAYGSLEDRRYASFDGEERLRERLADAMQEQMNGFHNTNLRNKSGSSSSNEFAAVEEATPFQFDSYHPSLEMPQDQ